MQKIWIFNHYALEMLLNSGGRHFWFVEKLKKRGYDVTVFCANTIDNGQNQVNIDGFYEEKRYEKYKTVLIKTHRYAGNGIARIKNMIMFARNLVRAAKKIALYSKPDIIIASSVHPLTLIAGLKLGKVLQVPCICEIRDLWPETLTYYGRLKKTSIFAKLLYKGEKWIYSKADALIFTMEGGKDYINEKGWEKEVPLSKVFHINNGVDLEQFEFNKKEFFLEDPDLDTGMFKVIYTGSINRVNNLGIILDVAKKIKQESDIKFLIWGDGNERADLENRVKNENIDNVVFKGKVEKKYIPGILSRSDLNLIHWEMSDILKFGASYNKMFEYLAAGKPILSTVNMGYSLLKRYNCGYQVEHSDIDSIAQGILKMKRMPYKKYIEMGHNAKAVASEYDFTKLTDKLEHVMDYAQKAYREKSNQI